MVECHFVWYALFVGVELCACEVAENHEHIVGIIFSILTYVFFLPLQYFGDDVLVMFYVFEYLVVGYLAPRGLCVVAPRRAENVDFIKVVPIKTPMLVGFVGASFLSVVAVYEA